MLGPAVKKKTVTNPGMECQTAVMPRGELRIFVISDIGRRKVLKHAAPMPYYVQPQTTVRDNTSLDIC